MDEPHFLSTTVYAESEEGAKRLSVKVSPGERLLLNSTLSILLWPRVNHGLPRH